MTIHLRPSHSYRWTRCAAAPTFESNVPPEPDSDEAREGTAAAWVADCVLKGDAATAEDLLGREHKNGWLVTFDMVAHVQGYIDFVRSLGGVTNSETFVRLNEFIAGTLDASTALSQNNFLYVNDLKYGFKIVDPYENTQLLIYGAAEMLRLMQSHAGWRPERIVLGIYQPRAFHPDGIYRTYELTPEQLWDHAQQIVAAGQRCQVPQPVATPGKHCTDCRAASSCVALAHSTYAGFQVIEDIRQKHLSAAELAKELDFLSVLEPMMKARLNAIKAEAETRVRGGEHVQGWGIRPTYGHRKFTVSPIVAKALTGIDPIEKKMMTPAEYERQGANVDIVKMISETPIVGHKLQRTDARAFNKAFQRKD